MSTPVANNRGEFNLADGKLVHYASNPSPEPVAQLMVHEGPWLSCDGCNPVKVVQADGEGFAQDNLRDLRREWSEAKAAERAAKDRATLATGKLKAAIVEASGNATRAALHVPGFKPMTLTYTEPWQFNMDELKAFEPETYVKYASKKPNGQWTLAESRVKS